MTRGRSWTYHFNHLLPDDFLYQRRCLDRRLARLAGNEHHLFIFDRISLLLLSSLVQYFHAHG